MTEPFEYSFRDVKAVFDGRELLLSNSRSSRCWHLENGWCDSGMVVWKISACSGEAVLQDISCEVIRGEFLRVSSVFYYPESHLYLKYNAECYPEVSGIRTQILLKAETEIPAVETSPEKDALPQFVTGFCDLISLQKEEYSYTGFGYNNDSQHRYTLETPILMEIHGTVSPETENHSIANCNGIIFTGKDGSGFIMVKESHKCANSAGISTGEFLLKGNCLCNTGLGFSDGSPHWLSGADYRSAWASWYIPFDGGKSGAIQALKEFDRARYPFRKDRDMFIAMNTWGSRGGGMLSRMAATEENVLAELESCADLGIDLLQIDDGWQFDLGTADFQNCAWEPSAKGFPEGWKNVRKKAAELNMKLGLWAAPDFVSAEQLLKNINDGGFRRIKLDFLNLTKRNLLDDLLDYARKITEHAENPIGINWDITENCPRMGFYFGREYGNIFLQNCENSPPGSSSKRFIAYDPEVTLNQTWLLARYFNLNQVQITIQRIAESCHGKGYPQDYACGIALMGNPLFFVETRRFSQNERNLIKKVISVYKEHREKILSGFVEPVGSQPDGSRWTGFQCRCSVSEGYLTLFREKDSDDESCRIRLNLPPGKKLILKSLYRGTDSVLEPENDGTFLFTGLSRSSWAFYQYEVQES